MEDLDIHRNKIARIEGLDYLHQLQRLDISENEIESLDALPWHSLKQVNASSNKIKFLHLVPEMDIGLDLKLSLNFISHVDVELHESGSLLYFDELDVACNQIADTTWLRDVSGTISIFQDNPLDIKHTLDDPIIAAKIANKELHLEY